MKCVIQTDKKSKRRRIIVSITIGIFVIILFVVCISVLRKKNVQISEEKQNIQSTVEPHEKPKKESYEKPEKEPYEAPDKELYEAQYIEFEKLFREHEADMKDFIELSQESILGEKEYLILFDEDWYSSMLSGNQSEERITILYDNNTFVLKGDEKIKEELNKNDDLAKTLDIIKEKEVIIAINLYYLDSSIQMTVFTVDTKYTPFITTNNGITNYFAYCNDEGCEKYGYKNIEGNWYMRISPAPE